MVDLPDPLSPTSPNVLPRGTESETPSTACTAPTRRWTIMPWVIGKCITRFSTRRIASAACVWVGVVAGVAISFISILPPLLHTRWLLVGSLAEYRSNDRAQRNEPVLHRPRLFVRIGHIHPTGRRMPRSHDFVRWIRLALFDLEWASRLERASFGRMQQVGRRAR